MFYDRDPKYYVVHNKKTLQDISNQTMNTINSEGPIYNQSKSLKRLENVFTFLGLVLALTQTSFGTLIQLGC